MPRQFMGGCTLLMLLGTASAASADHQIQIGLAKTLSYAYPAKAYSRTEQAQHFGWGAHLKYAFNQHFSIAAVAYKLDGDHDVQGWGNELHASAGFNLNQQGFQFFTGPSWFRENRKDSSALHDQNEEFSGFGWHLGTAYTYKSWSLGLTTTVRQNSDYIDYYEEKYSVQKSDSVWAASAITSLSYVF